MNAFVKKFVEKLNLISRKDIGFGTYRNFQVSVTYTNASMINLKFSIFSYLDSDQIAEIDKFILDNKKDLKYTKYSVTQMGILVTVSCMTFPGGLKTLEKCVDQIIDFISLKSLKNDCYCPICGEYMQERELVLLEDAYLYCDKECALKINNEYEQKEAEYNASPNNYGYGTIGAIVGGLIGAVVWVLVGVLLGIVSGWIAFLIAYLASVGYDKAKGKKSNVKPVITSIVTYVLVVISMFLIYYLLVAIQIQGTGYSPLSVLIELIKTDSSVRLSFIGDVVMSLIFSTFGVVISILQMKGKLHKKR